MRHEEFEESDIIVNKFTEESVKEFRKKVMRVSAVDSNMPIIIYIDSYGGNVDAFNSMLAILKSIPNTIITVCQGKAMSAGAALLAIGDVRFCDADARIMIHEASGGAAGNVDDIKTDATELTRLNFQVMNLIANRCGKTYEQLKGIIKHNEGRDLYLTAQEAKDIGIIDFIGLPMIRPTISYSIECIPTKKKVSIEKESKSTTKEIKKLKTDSKKKKK